ncbi:MAG: transporter, partial [Lachnospiraceae bacterium]|nr:transporter [Lachnospiraceae bacterium]
MKRYFFAICSILFFISMLAFPQSAFQGAKTGLLLWFNTVLPTLLPVIIISNLQVHSSAIDVAARIISPVLCRFFKVTPYGAFAILTGFLCGCPMGSKVTADL